MIFTPGPSNVSASALGSKVGYRKSTPYMVGMSISFFLILLISGLLTDFLKANYSQISMYLKWIGAAYIVWLVISLFIPAPQGQTDKSTGMGLVSGFLLVLLNPKGILFAITTFASFSELVAGSLSKVIGSALFLALLLYASSSTWALTGFALASLFNNRRFAIIFNIVMALFLLYSAYSIIVH
jgi:threonine/homoserine/homoserine lactone efflux protein